jgi:hypothetical protein
MILNGGMRSIFVAAALIAFLLPVPVVADWIACWKAYERSDFQIALQECRVAAETGERPSVSAFITERAEGRRAELEKEAGDWRPLN